VRTGVLFIIVYSTCTALLFLLLATVLRRHSFGEASPAERRARLPMLAVLSLSMVLGLLGSILNTVSGTLRCCQQSSLPLLRPL
jgi:NADH:ubiquinone oxidoreductase subunit 6 (subunit J)